MNAYANGVFIDQERKRGDRRVSPTPLHSSPFSFLHSSPIHSGPIHSSPIHSSPFCFVQSNPVPTIQGFGSSVCLGVPAWGLVVCLPLFLVPLPHRRCRLCTRRPFSEFAVAWGWQRACVPATRRRLVVAEVVSAIFLASPSPLGTGRPGGRVKPPEASSLLLSLESWSVNVA